MKKATKAIDTIQSMVDLIRMQESEIDKLRYIVARYHAKYGEEVERDIDVLTPNIDFRMSLSSQKEPLKCKKIDFANLAIRSHYMRMQKIINELNENENQRH